MTNQLFIETQLPKVKEAITETGGEYFQPTTTHKGKTTTIPWRHNARFGDRTLTFDKVHNDPYKIQFFEEGKPRRFKVSTKSPSNILVRQIKLFLKSA